MLKQTLLVVSLLAPMASFASVEDDVSRIRPLLPAGHDIAQVQASVLHGASDRNAAAIRNYVLRDLNGDGLEDVLVISEENPRLEDLDTRQPCEVLDYRQCDIVYGTRAIRFFTGERDGSFTPVFNNENYVRGADEGGTFGDPLEGFTERKNGAISLTVYGGSSWRWGFTDVFQFRKGHLYVIGQDSYYGWTLDLRSDTKSVNLLTGEVKETHQKNADTPVRTKRYRVKVKPLVKLADYKGQE